MSEIANLAMVRDATVALGARVRGTGDQRHIEYVEWDGEAGDWYVRAVRPASNLECKMWDCLVTPQSLWGVTDQKPVAADDSAATAGAPA